DFIDMTDPAHREQVMARLQEELKRDRNHARAAAISEFGLVEMTRKRTGPSLERLLTEPCPCCDGTGRRISAETALLEVYRELVRRASHLQGATLRLSLHPDLRAAIPAEVRDGLHHLARSAGAQVVWIDRSELPRHKVQLDIQGGRPEAP
ncbi:MAG TPA: ribonuclease E/G, partial [Holophaga sp.]|nr:ribonuclease E/G [Holophaga sp.]